MCGVSEIEFAIGVALLGKSYTQIRRLGYAKNEDIPLKPSLTTVGSLANNLSSNSENSGVVRFTRHCDNSAEIYQSVNGKHGNTKITYQRAIGE